ncbi:hypothetical protein Pmar_PMAR018823, partial [Perkinsus marinus ATCC 50983]
MKYKVEGDIGNVDHCLQPISLYMSLAYRRNINSNRITIKCWKLSNFAQLRVPELSSRVISYELKYLHVAARTSPTRTTGLKASTPAAHPLMLYEDLLHLGGQ